LPQLYSLSGRAGPSGRARHGVGFLDRKLTIHKLGIGALFGLANFFLVAQIWSLNDWADIDADRFDTNKHDHLFTAKGIKPAMMLWFSLALLSTSLGLFALLASRTFCIAVCIALLGFIYSFPGIQAKGTVLLSSIPHLVGGLLQFLLGYSLFAAIDRPALLTSLFFALIFTAGHAVQEVQDHDADRRAGLRTNAVVFGKWPVFWGALLAFIFAYGYLLCLAWTGLVAARLGPPVFVLGVLHLYWARLTAQAGLSFDSVRQFRQRYRALFAVIGLIVMSTLIF
jgi:4-hydroxybenzoate polyprenyltransferase